ncbi:hypothetical protein GWK08_06575 [Leptobacterium flavescens]|uniref:Uncharacterized protein n=1 Tax=Leptobacterium flavescens TaxID=472055 RepID=A0A6P0URT7_9FLAO|nr:hypothetical protein [Leptobacterium flavescens]NER13096.1 hypothetical protein [Leptobacterium flavescens]
MRILTVILIVLAVCLIGYNVTRLDFNALFEGDSMVAVIGIVASLCAILLLLIFTVSKKIEKKVKEGNRA